MARRLVENKYANASIASNPSTPVNRAIRYLLGPRCCRGNDRHSSMTRNNLECVNCDAPDLRDANRQKIEKQRGRVGCLEVAFRFTLTSQYAKIVHAGRQP